MKLSVLFGLIGLALCQNTTTRPGSYCKAQSRSACFLGSCPSGFECIGNQCCSEADVVQPGGDCTDYLDDCSNVECNSIGMQEFARANCAKTCNMCYSAVSVSPQYACTDLLTDCANRTSSCQDIDFVDMMALYCPRTCSLCLWQAATKIPNCGNQLSDCSTRGNYCSAFSISDYQKRVGCGEYCGLCSVSTRKPFIASANTNSNGFFFFGRK
uniref:ShKT domain-containing protein n=1 Tax=Caenorhabditis japonica TaxID=281687 RepID=A0A8R1I422_CAEJA